MNQKQKEIMTFQYSLWSENFSHKALEPCFPNLVGKKYALLAYGMASAIGHQLFFSILAEVINTGISIELQYRITSTIP